MITVLDTNVWISGLLFGGNPEEALIKAYEQGVIAICREIVAEIEEVAARKFSQRRAHLKARLDTLLLDALWATVQGEVHICRDPDDNIVLECAWNAKAQLIVSGDLDLLDLREFEGIRILTVGQFLSQH